MIPSSFLFTYTVMFGRPPAEIEVFLFDPSQTPHVKAADLYRAFGVGQSTGQGKSKLVRDVLSFPKAEQQ